ncbi:hypothetical protein CBER1_04203 [Cercospora berteroae]|uniref:Uncharacterized protein n=1 Tax=Cercospora berteroae TaxID=357750 RepID=A0A2S6CHV1_9PEZI|nr:hypothetical protein CBER1_04203 [Cercospora berteroae]
MRTTTILTYAAPNSVAVGLDAVTEDRPQRPHDSSDEDTPSLSISLKVYRKQRITSSSDGSESVDLWIDDFGNIEPIPKADSKEPNQRATSLKSSPSPPKDKPLQPLSQHQRQDAHSQQSVTEFLTELYRVGTPSSERVLGFFSGATGTLLYLSLSVVLLFFAAIAFVKSLPRPYRMRVGHRRGHSKYSL